MGKITDMTTAEIQAILEDSDEENYAFAYLSASEDTTITLADTWYPVSGTFENSLSNFIIEDGKLKCISTNKNKYVINWFTKSASDTVATTINATIAVTKDSVETIYETTKMGAYAKTSGEPVSFSGCEVVDLEYGNTVELVIESDKATSAITVDQFIASITKFIPKRQ